MHKVTHLSNGKQRMVKLEGTSAGHLPNPSQMKQHHLEQVAQDQVQVSFEQLQRKRQHKMLGCAKLIPGQSIQSKRVGWGLGFLFI